MQAHPLRFKRPPTPTSVTGRPPSHRQCWQPGHRLPLPRQMVTAPLQPPTSTLTSTALSTRPLPRSLPLPSACITAHVHHTLGGLYVCVAANVRHALLRALGMHHKIKTRASRPKSALCVHRTERMFITCVTIKHRQLHAFHPNRTCYAPLDPAAAAWGERLLHPP